MIFDEFARFTFATFCNVFQKSPDGNSTSILTSGKSLISDAISEEFKMSVLHKISVKGDGIVTFPSGFDDWLDPVFVIAASFSGWQLLS